MPRPRTIDKRGNGGVTSIALSGPLKTALDTVARREGVSRGFVIREALRRWFESYDTWNHEDGQVFSDSEVVDL